VVSLFVLALAAVWIVPFYWVVVSSFKDIGQVFSVHSSLFDFNFTLKNFYSLVEETLYPRWFLNSLIVAVTSTALATFLSALAGFAFSKYQFRGKNALFVVVLSSLMIPYQVTMIPVYLVFSKMGLLDSYLALVLPGMASAVGIFLMRQYMMGVPDELLDAARMDGCPEFRIFYQIVVPLIKPSLAALAIFLFLTSWNSFFHPMLMLSSERMLTVPLGLALLRGHEFYKVYYGEVMLGSAIGCIPLAIFFFGLQKQFIAGLTMGAVAAE
jgi:ABC-type glycerol-3-phosphate transport system permease component